MRQDSRNLHARVMVKNLIQLMKTTFSEMTTQLPKKDEIVEYLAATLD